MPRIKSAKKRVQVSERNRLRNVAFKSAVKTAIKRVITSVQAKASQEEIQQYLGKAFGVIDRAIIKGILHKNTGARYKSRIAKAAHKSTAA